MFPTVGKSSMIASSDWSGDEKHLKDFVKQFPLPTLGRIKRGEYSCIGKGKKLHDVIYIHSVYASHCVIAESHFAGKTTSVFAIPFSYGGWFDVLSEDKKCVKPATIAFQLLNCPSKFFLVRENTKTVTNLTSDPSKKGRELESGDILKWNENQDLFKSKKILTFRDGNDKTVLIDSTQKCSLSPIFKGDDVCGVHSIKDLAEHFSFPITVQLANGEFFSSKKFHPIFRLIGISNVQFVIVIPLKATTQVLSIPTSEMLTLTPPRDQKVFKTSDEFKEISKFAHSIENQQQKTMSQVTSSNLNINQNKKSDTSGESSKTLDHSAFEEIDAIYKFIREGGELSDFNIKDQFDDSIQISAPTRPIDALEREIWDEPIYADISKLKTQKMTKKKNKSTDSEFANIGTKLNGIEEHQKINSSYDKSLQKYKNKMNSTLQRNSIKINSENVMQSETSHKNTQDFQQIHEKYSPIKNDNTSMTQSVIGLKTVSRTMNTLNQQGQSLFDPIRDTKRETKLSPVEPHLKDTKTLGHLKDTKTLGHKEVQKFKASLNENNSELIYDKKLSADGLEGWNVSIMKNDQDEDSKRTCVKINYNPPRASMERFQPETTNATEKSEILETKNSEDRYTITFKQIPRDSSERDTNVNSKMKSPDDYNSYDNYSVDDYHFNEVTNVRKNNNTIRVLSTTSPLSSMPYPQTPDSPLDSLAMAHSESAFSVQNTTTSSESPSIFSSNVSTIRFGPSNPPTKIDDNPTSQRHDDARSVKIICNSSSNFGGTLSSRTILEAGTLKHLQLPPPYRDETNRSCENQNYPGTTTIKIDKSSSSQMIERNNISDKQVINTSPFGNTQIHIRQAFPSKGNSGASSKLYINKS